MTRNVQARNPVEVLANEFLDRYRRGERPPITEYQERYPELASQIGDLFPALAWMEQAAPESEPMSTHSPTATPLPPLEQLGDFRIIREIGRGGMGVVYEAEQESLGRKVALKVLPRQLTADQTLAQRFQREARAAARLHHTNIVPVFGVGQQEGLHYYVMQFIDGLGLDKVLIELQNLRSRRTEPNGPAQRGLPRKQDVTPPSPDDASRTTGSTSFTCGLASGVSAESASGLIRKGESTLREPRTETGHGEADARQPTQTSDSSGRYSLPGQTTVQTKGNSQSAYWESVAHIGMQAAQALQYAHEQGIVHRDVKPANLLLDLHGNVWVTDFGLAKATNQKNLTDTDDVLGTLRYMAPEQLEGLADPRSDIYSLGLTLYELLALRPVFPEQDRHKLFKQVSVGAVPRLRALDVRIPRDLETIVHKALEREPSHRYQTAGELAEDLERYLRDEPIRAKWISPVTRLGRWCRRNPIVALLAAVVALLLPVVAAFGALAVNHSLREVEARLALRQAELDKRTAELRATQIEQHRLLEKRSRLDAEQRAQEAETQRLEAEVNVLVEEAQRLSSGATPDFTRAVQLLTDALQHRPAEGRLYLFRGSARYELGAYEEAIADLERSLELQPRDNPAAHWLLALILQQVGDETKACRHMDEAQRQQPHSIKSLVIQALALPFDRRGIEMLSQAIDQDPFDPMLYYYRGRAEYNLTARKAEQRDFHAATVDLEKAIRGRPFDLRMMETLARCLTSFHFLDANSPRALARVRQLLDQWLEIRPGDVAALAVLAQWQRASGRAAEAVETCNRAGESEPLDIRLACQLGWACRDLGQHEQAVAALSRVVTRSSESEASREAMISVYAARATSNFALGRTREAQQDLDQALRFSAPQSWTFFDWYSVVSAQRTLGNHDEGLKWCQRFVEAAPECGQAWLLRGLLREDLGQHQQGVADMIQAIKRNPSLDAAYIGLLGEHTERSTDG